MRLGDGGQVAVEGFAGNVRLTPVLGLGDVFQSVFHGLGQAHREVRGVLARSGQGWASSDFVGGLDESFDFTIADRFVVDRHDSEVVIGDGRETRVGLLSGHL